GGRRPLRPRLRYDAVLLAENRRAFCVGDLRRAQFPFDRLERGNFPIGKETSERQSSPRARRTRRRVRSPLQPLPIENRLHRSHPFLRNVGSRTQACGGTLLFYSVRARQGLGSPLRATRCGKTRLGRQRSLKKCEHSREPICTNGVTAALAPVLRAH